MDINIVANIHNVIAEIQQSQITLVAVSKTKPITAILQAQKAGIRHFGENYIQEAVQKISVLHDQSLIWHYLGKIQSNKCKIIAEHFDWVQSVDSLKQIDLLDTYRGKYKEKHTQKLQICIQVNIDNETQKNGCTVQQLPQLASTIANTENLQLRGIMILPQIGNPHTFSHGKDIFNDLQKNYQDIDTLSMGMSSDYPQAIQAGSTMIRLGTTLFGART